MDFCENNQIAFFEPHNRSGLRQKREICVITPAINVRISISKHNNGIARIQNAIPMVLSVAGSVQLAAMAHVASSAFNENRLRSNAERHFTCKCSIFVMGAGKARPVASAQNRVERIMLHIPFGALQSFRN